MTQDNPESLSTSQRIDNSSRENYSSNSAYFWSEISPHLITFSDHEEDPPETPYHDVLGGLSTTRNIS